MKRSLFGVGLVAAVLAASWGFAAKEPTLKVGVIAELTGDMPTGINATRPNLSFCSTMRPRVSRDCQPTGEGLNS